MRPVTEPIFSGIVPFFSKIDIRPRQCLGVTAAKKPCPGPVASFRNESSLSNSHQRFGPGADKVASLGFFCLDYLVHGFGNDRGIKDNTPCWLAYTSLKKHTNIHSKTPRNCYNHDCEYVHQCIYKQGSQLLTPAQEPTTTYMIQGEVSC